MEIKINDEVLDEPVARLSELVNKCDNCKFATCEQCEINWKQIQDIKCILSGLQMYRLLYSFKGISIDSDLINVIKKLQTTEDIYNNIEKSDVKKVTSNSKEENQSLLKKILYKDKMIELMLSFININSECPFTEFDGIKTEIFKDKNYCDLYCDENIEYNCWKKYFEEKTQDFFDRLEEIKNGNKKNLNENL